MTFRLTPQMSAALRAGQSPLAPLVEVVLPGYTMRHLVGAGEVAWGDKVFTGVDARRRWCTRCLFPGWDEAT